MDQLRILAAQPPPPPAAHVPSRDRLAFSWLPFSQVSLPASFCSERPKKAQPREEMLQRDTVRPVTEHRARLLMSRLITSNNDLLYATFISYQTQCYASRAP